MSADYWVLKKIDYLIYIHTINFDASISVLNLLHYDLNELYINDLILESPLIDTGDKHIYVFCLGNPYYPYIYLYYYLNI